MKRIKLLFIATGLNRGGAEMMLLKLLPRITSDRFEVRLLSLTGFGTMSQTFADHGIEVRSVELNYRKPLASMRALLCEVREFGPDVIQSWMYHADFVTIVLKCFLPRATRIVWGIRNFNVERGKLKTSTRIVAKICAWFSRLIPHAILTNAVNTKKVHVDYGYSPHHFAVIPNGFDTEAMKHDLKKRKALRECFKIRNDETLVGVVARFDPIKGHKFFIESFEKICLEHDKVKAIFIGGGNLLYRKHIEAEVACRASLSGRVIFAGEQDDMQ